MGGRVQCGIPRRCLVWSRFRLFVASSPHVHAPAKSATAWGPVDWVSCATGRVRAQEYGRLLLAPQANLGKEKRSGRGGGEQARCQGTQVRKHLAARTNRTCEASRGEGFSRGPSWQMQLIRMTPDAMTTDDDV